MESRDSAGPGVYQPFESTARANRHLIVRAAVPPLALSHALRDAVASIDRDQPVSDIRTMEAVFDSSAAHRRFDTVLIEIFAVLGLAMVVVESMESSRVGWLNAPANLAFAWRSERTGEEL